VLHAINNRKARLGVFRAAGVRLPLELLLAIELAELSISLLNAASLARDFWPGSSVSLAPSHAWLGYRNGDTVLVLVLASASELEGLQPTGIARQPPRRLRAGSSSARLPERAIG
jgi:hypothetical protein